MVWASFRSQLSQDNVSIFDAGGRTWKTLCKFQRAPDGSPEGPRTVKHFFVSLSDARIQEQLRCRSSHSEKTSLVLRQAPEAWAWLIGGATSSILRTHLLTSTSSGGRDSISVSRRFVCAWCGRAVLAEPRKHGAMPSLSVKPGTKSLQLAQRQALEQTIRRSFCSVCGFTKALCVALAKTPEEAHFGHKGSVQDFECTRRTAARLLTVAQGVPGLFDEFMRMEVELPSLIRQDATSSLVRGASLY